MSYHFPREKSTTQRCAKCGITKQYKEFPPHPGRKNKIGHYCNLCEQDYQQRLIKQINIKETKNG